jgi:YD repeat-containing protein
MEKDLKKVRQIQKALNRGKVFLLGIFFFLCSLSVSFAANIVYTYDVNGQLAKVDYGYGKSITYVYDASGNKLSRILFTSLEGDVNTDKRVNLTDAILSMQTSADLKPTVSITGDVNGDGKIGLPESIYILQKAAGIR